MAEKPRPHSRIMSSSSRRNLSFILPSPRHNPYGRASAEGNFAPSVVQARNSNISNEHASNNRRSSGVIPPTTPARCDVCGDTATGCYYGCIGCSGCATFFQRSVANDSYIRYFCRRAGYCTIDVHTKPSCSFCRFRKCIIFGMNTTRVAMDEERRLIELINSQREKWNILQRIPHPHCSFLPVAVKADCLTNADQIQIASIVRKYHQACTLYPFSEPAPDRDRTAREIVELCHTAIRRFINFSRLFEDFASLPAKIQVQLLRTSILEMFVLRGTICVDMKGKGWPNSEIGKPGDFPIVTMRELHAILSSSLFCLDMDFMFTMQNLGIDEPIAMLLVMAVLFNPNRAATEMKKTIQGIRSKYILLLQKYAHLKFGSSDGTRICMKYITQLRTLTKLGHFHDRYLINLDDNAFRIIGNLFDTELDTILQSGARNIPLEIPRRAELLNPVETRRNSISTNPTLSTPISAGIDAGDITNNMA